MHQKNANERGLNFQQVYLWHREHLLTGTPALSRRTIPFFITFSALLVLFPQKNIMKAAIDDDYALALRLQNEEDTNARNGNVMWRTATSSNRVASEYEQWEQNPNLRIPPDTEYAYSPSSVSAINVDTTSPRYDASGHVIHEDPISSDTRYAYFLQMMEFEIQDDLQENRHEDFENREIASSNWKKQLLTPSTVLCVIQIAFLIAMVSQVRMNTLFLE